MFSYYGSKSKIVKEYPKPNFDTIIEPFAGSARYSLLNFEKNVILHEINEKVFRVWQYLQDATEESILSLPDLEKGQSLTDFSQLIDEERWLIGFHLCRGTSRPCTKCHMFCAWNRDKIRISKEVFKIKHWQILKESFNTSENIEATWFIDPPYQHQSHRYTNWKVDYPELKLWVEERKGEVIVCGNQHDTWIELNDLKAMHGNKGKFMERMYYRSDFNNNSVLNQVLPNF